MADPAGGPPRDTGPSGWRQLPPDPEEYDSERNEHARKRGLAAPYIPGGRDPEPEKARQEERRLLRILLLMVIAIVLSGFVLGIVGNLFVAQ